MKRADRHSTLPAAEQTDDFSLPTRADGTPLSRRELKELAAREAARAENASAKHAAPKSAAPRQPSTTPLTPARHAASGLIRRRTHDAALGRTAMRGIAASAGGQVARAVIQIGSVAILARLLTPAEYGLLAMVLVVIGVGEIMRDFGLSNAAIRDPHLTRDERDALFWLNLAIGVVLGVVLFLGAPLVAWAFHEPALTEVTRLLSITFLLNGAVTQYRAGLARDLQFQSLVVVDLAGQISGVATAVGMAMAGYGVWALAAQQIVNALVALLAAVLLAGWLPGRPAPGTSIRRFLTFGWHLAASQLIGYAANNVDTLTIGLRMGSAPLGLYNRAFQLLMQSYNMARDPLNRVAVPVFSRVQDEEERFSTLVLRAQLCLGYLISVALAVVAGLAEPVVAIMLGPTWMASAPVLALLSISASFMTLAYVGYWIYVARGLTQDLMRYTLVTALLTVVCVLVGSQWGMVGVAAGYCAATVVEWPISFWWLSRKTPLPTAGLYAGALRIIAFSAVAGAGAWAGTLIAAAYGPFAQLALGIADGAVLLLLATTLPIVRRDLAEVRATVAMVRK